MMDESHDFFVTGKVIDYLNYKSYIENKDTCASSIENRAAVKAGHADTAGKSKGKEDYRAGFYNSNRNGY